MKGSNPFTDPGYEVKCEEDEYAILKNGPSIKKVFLYYLFL